MLAVTTADQLIRYADVDGRAVAWTAVGEGPPLVLGGWWCSHLGLDWQDMRFRRFVLALAEDHRVIRYDRPGSGLSDRDGPTPRSLAQEVAVLLGLIDAVGLESPALFGGSSGSVVAAGCAAAMPDRVSRLVLYGGYANGREIASPAARAAMVDLVRRHWGLGSRVLADVFVPGASAEERADFARFQRQVASPEAAAQDLSLVYAHDATELLARVTVPTLVLHRRDDRAIPVALGRDLASSHHRCATGRAHRRGALPLGRQRGHGRQHDTDISCRPGPRTRCRGEARRAQAVRPRGRGATPGGSWGDRRADRRTTGPEPAHRASPPVEHQDEAWCPLACCCRRMGSTARTAVNGSSSRR